MFHILDSAFKIAGVIALLAATGNPRVVQDHLRHQSARMTLRYMTTLNAKESLKLRQGVDWQW